MSIAEVLLISSLRDKITTDSKVWYKIISS